MHNGLLNPLTKQTPQYRHNFHPLSIKNGVKMLKYKPFIAYYLTMTVLIVLSMAYCKSGAHVPNLDIILFPLGFIVTVCLFLISLFGTILHGRKHLSSLLIHAIGVAGFFLVAYLLNFWG